MGGDLGERGLGHGEERCARFSEQVSQAGPTAVRRAYGIAERWIMICLE